MKILIYGKIFRTRKVRSILKGNIDAYCIVKFCQLMLKKCEFFDRIKLFSIW